MRHLPVECKKKKSKLEEHRSIVPVSKCPISVSQSTVLLTRKKKKEKKREINSKPGTAWKESSCFVFAEGITNISH